jgi:hypothetical protein
MIFLIERVEVDAQLETVFRRWMRIIVLLGGVK